MTDIQQINYENPATQDTGETNAESLPRINNAEPFDAPTLNRLPEAIRQRIEVNRGQINRLRWLAETQRGPFVIELPRTELTWDGDQLSMDNPQTQDEPRMIISPFIRPGTPRNNENEDTNRDAWTRFATLHVVNSTENDPGDDPAPQFQFISQKFAYEGGNEITIRAVADDTIDGTQLPILEIDGTASPDPDFEPGRDNITIVFHPDDHTVGDVVDAFDEAHAQYSSGAPQAALDVDARYYGDGTSSNDAMFEFDEKQFSGGVDGIRFEITDTTLSAANITLQDRDTLAIALDDVSTWRESIGTSVDVVADQLINVSKSPERSAFSVPICTASEDSNGNNNLVFVNGFKMKPDDTTTTMQSGAEIRRDLYQPAPGVDPPPVGDSSVPGAGRVLADASGWNVLQGNAEVGNSDAYTIQELLSDADQHLYALSQAVSGNNSDIGSLETDQDDLETDVSNLFDRLNSLESNVAPGYGTPFIGHTVRSALEAANVYYALPSLAGRPDHFRVTVDNTSYVVSEDTPLPLLAERGLGDTHPKEAAFDGLNFFTLANDATDGDNSKAFQYYNEDNGNIHEAAAVDSPFNTSEFNDVYDAVADGRNLLYVFRASDDEYYITHHEVTGEGLNLQQVDLPTQSVNLGDAASGDQIPTDVITDGESAFILYWNPSGSSVQMEKRRLSNLEIVDGSASVSIPGASSDSLVPAALNIFEGRIHAVVENHSQDQTFYMYSNEPTSGFDEVVELADDGGGSFRADNAWLTDKAAYFVDYSAKTLTRYYLTSSYRSGILSQIPEQFFTAAGFHAADIDFDENYIYIAAVNDTGSGTGEISVIRVDRENPYYGVSEHVFGFNQPVSGQNSHSFYDSSDLFYYDVSIRVNGTIGYLTATDVSASPSNSKIYMFSTGVTKKEYIYTQGGDDTQHRHRYRAFEEVR